MVVLLEDAKLIVGNILEVNLFALILIVRDKESIIALMITQLMNLYSSTDLAF